MTVDKLENLKYEVLETYQNIEIKFLEFDNIFYSWFFFQDREFSKSYYSKDFSHSNVIKIIVRGAKKTIDFINKKMNNSNL